MPNSYVMYQFVPFVVGLEQQGPSFDSALNLGAPDGKPELASAWEVQQVPRIIYKISGSQKMALDLVRSTEKARSLAPPPRSSKVAESMYKYL